MEKHEAVKSNLMVCKVVEQTCEFKTILAQQHKKYRIVQR